MGHLPTSVSLQRQAEPGWDRTTVGLLGFLHKRGALGSLWQPQQASFSPEARVWQEYAFPVASGCGGSVRMLATAHN